MSPHRYLVVEYFPVLLDGRADLRTAQPARMDGHYAYREDAEGVAELWAESPLHEGSRIVVAEVVTVHKDPAHWSRDDGEAAA